MKKNIIAIISLVFLLFTADSCREDQDSLSDYYTSRQLADSSYTEQFKLIWTFIDQNYCFWDYESNYGFNWDEVYKNYLPRFEELDKKK